MPYPDWTREEIDAYRKASYKRIMMSAGEVIQALNSQYEKDKQALVDSVKEKAAKNELDAESQPITDAEKDFDARLDDLCDFIRDRRCNRKFIVDRDFPQLVGLLSDLLDISKRIIAERKSSEKSINDWNVGDRCWVFLDDNIYPGEVYTIGYNFSILLSPCELIEVYCEDVFSSETEAELARSRYLSDD